MPVRKATDAGELSPAAAVVIDFTNVKDRGAFNPKHKPSGDYRAKIEKVEQTRSQAGNMMWVFTITVAGDAQASYPYRCVLDENNAWKIRNVFLACGINVPKKRLKVDPNKAVGKVIGVTLADDEFDGKMKSVVDALFPASELPAAKTKSSAKSASVEEDDEIDEEEEVDEDEMEMEVDEL